MRRQFACLLVAVACTKAAQGQVVRGTVVDNSDRSVSGVVVLLVDASAREVGRALTNERGEYRLTAPRAGSYRVRTLRIGFQSVLTPPMALVEGDNVERKLSLTNVAFALDTVRAVGRNVCRVVAGDSTSVVSALWEQVRSALIATQLTLATRTLFTTTLTYDRKIDHRTGRVGRQNVDVRGEYVRQPWRSLSPDSLRKTGYVYTDAGDMRTYNAPDLAVLLSDAFTEDHCLRIAGGSNASRLGIEFEPTSDRKKIPEIRGTVWLNRATSELSDLEFGYANISPAEEKEAGGSIGFTRMRNGMWAISRWSIRMPMLALVPGVDKMHFRGDKSFVVDSILVTGGELVMAVAVSARRDTVWMRPRLDLRGVVLDSASGRPVAQAVVTLGGTVQMDTTDRDGRFAISGVLPGRYAIETRTPSLDSVGTVDQRTILFADSSMSMTVRVPNATQVVGNVCSGSRETPYGKGIVIGTLVAGGNATPQANAKVIAAWTAIAVGSREPGMIGNRRQTIETRTDARGIFRFCGLPVNTSLTLTAATDSGESSPLPLRLPEGQVFARAELIIDRPRR